MRKYVAYAEKAEEELYTLTIPENVAIDIAVVSNWIKDMTANSFELVDVPKGLTIRRVKDSTYNVILGTVKTSQGIVVNIHIYGIVTKMSIKSL